MWESFSKGIAIKKEKLTIRSKKKWNCLVNTEKQLNSKKRKEENSERNFRLEKPLKTNLHSKD